MINMEIKRIKRIESEPCLFCFDDCVATIANYYGYEYELMFTGGMKILKNEESPLFASTYKIQFMDLVHNLNTYHGLVFDEIQNITADEYRHMIKREIECSVPVLVHFDTFWCPWDLGYQKFSTEYGHYFIIIGLLENGFQCIDPYFQKDGLELTYELFEKGIRSIYLVSCEERDSKDVYEAALIKTCNDMLDNRFIEQLRNLAEDINKSENIFNEIESDDVIWASPLIMLMMLINQGISALAIETRYVADKIDSKELGFDGEAIWNYSIQWKQVRKLIIKLYFIRKKDEQLKNDILKKINYIIDLLYDTMIKILRRNNSSDMFVKIDLKQYFNNAAFSDFDGEQLGNNLADFTSIGHVYISNVDKSTICNNSFILYNMDEIYNNTLDNITCNGQKIYIPSGVYNEIAIVGAAEFGDSTDIITLSGYHGLKQLEVKFIDYIYESQEGGKIIWKGKGVHKTDLGIEVMHNDLYLYEKKYSLLNDTINEIILPINPSIHIFAITLIK